MQTETEQQVSMREVEPAVVIALDYSISNDGTSNTCARVELQLTAPDSPLLGRTFQVELPPPNCGHAEFVIPRHRFLTSVHKRWIHPAECQVCYCALIVQRQSVGHVKMFTSECKHKQQEEQVVCRQKLLTWGADCEHMCIGLSHA